MDRKITDSQEAFLDACAERGYDPAKVLPDVSAMPEWLARYNTAANKRLIIAEWINGGRVPKYGETMYFPYWDKDPSGLGFSDSFYVYWYTLTITYVGARLEFFSRKDANYFGSNFMDLHADVLLYRSGDVVSKTSATETAEGGE